MKRPLGVSLISYFYIFGAIVLLSTAFFYNVDDNSIGIAERFGIPNVHERLLRVIVAIFSMGMVYGYIRLKKWGFWLIVIYSVFFGLISSSLISNQSQQPFIGNLIWSIIVLAYTFYVKKAFFKTGVQQ
ncbi:hypothetical protein QRD90_01865 [Peribacillus frigoritolerans]|uniref:hypothetical protein n=1 Tax=Peribacillus frigoritolerans TaxID=450367 RepID=UPI002079A98C|nr:hypothetical protein [Peribacillus frigoritolerans]USK80752.1 hypothetical protein LHV56_01865 [Peribacillus frigoritolerans]WJE48024.1 hypothetical protein QRD90_01865 [Peribacillus frigoritolerans]